MAGTVVLNMTAMDGRGLIHTQTQHWIILIETTEKMVHKQFYHPRVHDTQKLNNMMYGMKQI